MPLLRTFLLIVLAVLTSDLRAQTTLVHYLSGTGSDDTVPWDFRVSGGRQGGQWTTIPVPSNWEMQGFGTYRYYSDWRDDPAPDSIGQYRHRFALPRTWQGRQVDLVFGGVMTDAEVRLNGRLAGAVHRGGFYTFRYDVTGLLRFGDETLLEVTVRKFSTDPSVNRAERTADFWLFGGIFRPVWLEARPAQHVVRTALDARHTGDLRIDVFLGGLAAAGRVTARVLDLDGSPVGLPFSADVRPGMERVTLRAKVDGVRPWSAEWPNRYRVRVRLEAGGGVLHEVAETFGFRTVEVRPKDGIYVNGAKVRLKGVNRHAFWPTTGRTTNRTLSVADVSLIKDMNMNAVRMSHYPPDPHFLAACDSLGLYVVDELTGWQAAYSTEAGTPLVRETVVRDVNHPSVILWANGNEGGWNPELDDDFAQYDPQARTVIHPWANFNGLNTSHYEAYDCCTGWFFQGDDLILPTEFLHALYDGGGGAGLDDWWKRMVRHPLAAGGFLWAFADEGIVRADRDGQIDVAGNSAPDGVVGPYREKEGSFYTIKEVWSPVYFEWSELDRLPPSFDGRLRVENRYDFTDLSRVRFTWELIDFATPLSGDTASRVVAAGTATAPSIPPHGVDTLSIDLPEAWRQHDVLALTATDPHGREVYAWTWMVAGPADVAARLVRPGTGRATGAAGDGIIGMRANGTEVQIDQVTGLLLTASRDGTPVPLENGPRFVAGEAAPTAVRHFADGSDYVVEATSDGPLRRIRWRMLPSGWLRLDYAYHYLSHDTAAYLGITFDVPEDEATGLRWLGAGPYRVWKNRLKGVTFGVWQKAYNDAVTGSHWAYPEFKGFHRDVYWATLHTKRVPITMVVASDDVFLRLFTPAEAVDPRTTHVAFPPGDLSFLHGIAPIGTKFHAAADHGPAGAPNLVPRHGRTYEGTVFFSFGTELPALR